MLAHLIASYGADHFVAGSDYPLTAGLAHPVQEVRALGLDASDEAKILARQRSRASPAWLMRRTWPALAIAVSGIRGLQFPGDGNRTWLTGSLSREIEQC
jgi:hypothetical protein